VGGDFPTSTEAEILIKAHKLNLEAFGSKHQLKGLKLHPKMIEKYEAHVLYIFIWLIRLFSCFHLKDGHIRHLDVSLLLKTRPGLGENRKLLTGNLVEIWKASDVQNNAG